MKMCAVLTGVHEPSRETSYEDTSDLKSRRCNDRSLDAVIEEKSSFGSLCGCSVHNQPGFRISNMAAVRHYGNIEGRNDLDCLQDLESKQGPQKCVYFVVHMSGSSKSGTLFLLRMGGHGGVGRM